MPTQPIVDLAEDKPAAADLFPVPESATPTIHDGAPVEVSVTALNEKFKGTISRSAGQVDRATRTMHTEVDVPNPDGRYKPGHDRLRGAHGEGGKGAIAVPVQAISSGDKPSVMLIGPKARSSSSGR